MDCEKMIQDLRAYAEWADANEYYVPLPLPDLLRDAAKMIEKKDMELSAMRFAARFLKDSLDKQTERGKLVEVVRCRDCVYVKNAKVNKKGYRICPASHMEIVDDDFCSYGERKDESKND